MKNSQKLLNKIQNKKIKQTSHFMFVFKNIIFWIMFIFSIIIGGLSFSVILFAFTQTDFDLFSHINDSKIEFVLGLLPILWIVFCIIFLFVSIYGIKHTKTGYRYSPLKIYGSSIIVSIIVGISLFSFGGSEKIEQIFARNIPIYRTIGERRISRWSEADNGFLSGIIIENEKYLIIEDWNNKEWEIDFLNASIRGQVSLEKDEMIKMTGEVSGSNTFRAEAIGPWKGQGREGGKRRLEN